MTDLLSHHVAIVEDEQSRQNNVVATVDSTALEDRAKT